MNTKVVEFFGMPKAGKSTQIDIIETYLKREKEKNVRVVLEGARICPIDKKQRMLYNAWSLNDTINKIIEALDQKFDYVIVDRGIIDHIAFSKALYKSGLITKAQAKSTIEYALQFISLEYIAIGCMISPTESLNRESKYSKVKGRVINETFLGIMFESYQNVINDINSLVYLLLIRRSQ